MEEQNMFEEISKLCLKMETCNGCPFEFKGPWSGDSRNGQCYWSLRKPYEWGDEIKEKFEKMKKKLEKKEETY